MISKVKTANCCCKMLGVWECVTSVDVGRFLGSSWKQCAKKSFTISEISSGIGGPLLAFAMWKMAVHVLSIPGQGCLSSDEKISQLLMDRSTNLKITCLDRLKMSRKGGKWLQLNPCEKSTKATAILRGPYTRAPVESSMKESLLLVGIILRMLVR